MFTSSVTVGNQSVTLMCVYIFQGGCEEAQILKTTVFSFNFNVLLCELNVFVSLKQDFKTHNVSVNKLLTVLISL